MTICFPHPPGSGGPGVFQTRFENYLKSYGWKVCYKDSYLKPDIIFVIGGTRYLFWLVKMKLKGVPVIQRLDGIPWLHRHKKINLFQFLKVELSILNTKIIYSFISSFIIYQSLFSKIWWEREGWKIWQNYAVIFNGVNLPAFIGNPSFSGKIVILEGNIDYTPYAVKLINELADLIPRDFAVHLYGNFEDKKNIGLLNSRIFYNGFISNDKVYQELSGSIYLSIDINPACPNTVLEAMASGAPVVAFDTGALKEIVNPDAGILVPYGSDPWELKYPDAHALLKAILKISENYSIYSLNARKLAESNFTIEKIFGYYLYEINRLIKQK